MAAGEGAHHGQTGVNNLLRGSRTRSYGSLVQSSLSPVRQTRIQHTVQPGDTLQGLALKYGVSTEEIKRANRLYTNDSIFLKKTLSIPLLSDTDAYSGQTARDDSDESPNHVPVQNGKSASSSKRMQVDGESELSPMDFLKRMDHLISVSKQAAVKGCEEGEKRFADLEAVCTSRSPDGHRLTRSQSATTISSHRMHQAALGAVPLTITKRTKNLREREDDIFEL